MQVGVFVDVQNWGVLVHFRKNSCEVFIVLPPVMFFGVIFLIMCYVALLIKQCGRFPDQVGE